MTILAVVSHPDDEVLFGASIARWTAEGCEVFVLALADGETSRIGAGDLDVQRRFAKHCESAKALGFSVLREPPFPDQRLDVIPLLEMTICIEEAIRKVKPSIVYTHSPGDLNADHRRVYKAVLPAVRPKSGVKAVYCFEGPAMMRPFNPTTFVQITAEQLEQQISAARCYGDELTGEEGRIRMRAAMAGARVGVAFAQEFETVRVMV